MKPMLIALLITLSAVLAGCGEYGPLYLPESKEAQAANNAKNAHDRAIDSINRKVENNGDAS